MSTAANILTRYSIPSIIVLKVAVISYILLGDSKVFTFGDKPLWGQTEPKVEEKVAIAPDATSPAAGLHAEEGEVIEKKRRSFLDDLLNLPKINTESMDKDEIGRYFTMLERKQSQIENRIQILSGREVQLKNLEKSLDEKIKKLEDEMTFFQQTVQKEKQLQGERLDKLIEFYQKMEAKKAAAVFEKLDKDLVVSLFNRFPQKQTTQVLALMNPDRSVELSEYYGRIKSAKEYELLKEINVALRGQFEECKGLPRTVP
jgi:flagellar motility protein MotE (MotC chaperone)